MTLNVLLTTVGAQTSPSIIKTIKENGEKSIKLVGIDPVDIIPGAFMVDKFYKVTASYMDEKKFIDELINIVKKENIDVLLPCGNEDCLAVAKNRKIFEDLGVHVVLSNYETLQASFDKYNAYNMIKKHVPKAAPKYYLVKNYDDFIKYSYKLGYPEKKIVLKPRHGRGGRGVLILDPDINFNEILSNKPGGIYPYNTVEEMIKNNNSFNEFVLMEYLPGKIYSTYCLCKSGESLITIPNVRIWGNASNTLIGKIELNEDVINAVNNVNKIFKFDYNINYELKISEDGKPVIFDVNPRLAASTAIFRSIGINMPYLSIKLSLGEDIVIPIIKEEIIMMRYLKEMYLKVENGEVFEL